MHMFPLPQTVIKENEYLNKSWRKDQVKIKVNCLLQLEYKGLLIADKTQK